jgi:hypothetical protein
MRASAPAAVETTTAAAMEATSSGTATVKASTYSTTIAATGISAAASITTAIAATTVTVACTTSIAVTSTAIAITAVEPGAGADEDATVEVRRPIVAVGRASIRRVPVISVFASRGVPIAAVVRGASDTDTNRNLCVRLFGNRRHQEKSNC